MLCIRTYKGTILLYIRSSIVAAESVNPRLSDAQVREAIFAGEVPRCLVCKEGVARPAIVFFGDPLPQRFKDLYEDDLGSCDLLIVMGTSLQVQPFAGLIHRVKETTPRLLVNPKHLLYIWIHMTVITECIYNVCCRSTWRG